VLLVGLTGGVGAGKSTAARRLAALGAVVVDADAVAREVVAPGTPGLAAVAAEFGGSVLAPDGSLDRAALGRLVFAEPARRRALEAVTHPRIGARTEELVAAAAAADPAAVVVHDIPLLVELGRGDRYHLVAVVHAPAEERVRRLVAERGMAEDDARARVAAQADDAARRAAADAWLDNAGPSRDGGPAGLLAAVDALWHGRLAPFEAHLRAARRAPRPPRPVLVPPDPAWAAAGARLVARVRRAAGRRALDVQHTGSTAVPGLPAKDVVDLQVVAADLDAAVALAADLTAAGLVAQAGQWWDQPVSGGGRLPKGFAASADPGRAVNCHVRSAASPVVAEVLRFRDRLRADAADRAAYAALKQRLAAEHHDVDAYAAAKAPFITEVLARARE
jgi:dephospho-CoA kinase